MMSSEPTPSSEENTKNTPAFSALWTILSVALVVATLFTLWTPANLFSNQMLDRMFQAIQSDPTLTYPT
ncbi:MAG TPA: hypothetical protein DCE76_11410, partial [Anaerolineaceae bacterium]|nr:hypothetical protein [Anaerolineaceae bacterium]